MMLHTKEKPYQSYPWYELQPYVYLSGPHISKYNRVRCKPYLHKISILFQDNEAVTCIHIHNDVHLEITIFHGFSYNNEN